MAERSVHLPEEMKLGPVKSSLAILENSQLQDAAARDGNGRAFCASSVCARSSGYRRRIHPPAASGLPKIRRVGDSVTFILTIQLLRARKRRFIGRSKPINEVLPSSVP